MSGTLAVADEVAPAAKLAYAAIFGASMWITKRFLAVRAYLKAMVNMLLALSAMLLIIALLPEDWSRGFGVGLGGMRFSLLPTVIYAAGALLSGLVFSLSEAKCSARNSRPAL